MVHRLPLSPRQPPVAATISLGMDVPHVLRIVRIDVADVIRQVAEGETPLVRTRLLQVADHVDPRVEDLKG